MSIDRKTFYEKVEIAKERIINLNGKQKRCDRNWWCLLSEKVFSISRYVNRNDPDLSKVLIEVVAWIELWVCSKDSF
ncbi:MAG: hypothetical protein OXM61_17155 [Candidatus Poribacteria bacterium]|nr:hypothetical protein [Candidatus Poribacteria bacterium]